MHLTHQSRVTMVTTWGSDEAVIEAARMSVSKGFVSWAPYEGHPRGDQGLLEYLYNHKHLTPFEMCGAVFDVETPIFVARQWMRHRTQSYNEHSARYSELPHIMYLPTVDRLRATSGGNKQAGRRKGTDCPSTSAAVAYREKMADHAARSIALYEEGLRLGIPRELVRTVLPTAQYTKFRASANLRNWLGFLALRLDEHAQVEIREPARRIEDYLAEVFPRIMRLGRQNV